jgi:retron-type reverse transcriptase
MSAIESLKLATSLHDVAALLGFKAAGLSYILYVKSPQSKYRSFEIRKRSGGARQINAPIPELMLLQRKLSDLLQECVEDINKLNNRKDQLAHGFKRGRSIITNATKHRKRRYVLNIDLQDFFGTINFGRVRGFFIKDKNFALQPNVATVLAQIACYQNSLPQGSPCSPVISNLIGHVVDIHLGKLAFDSGCTYSRYADDITFSTNKRTFPPEIAVQIKGEKHEWEVGHKLQSIVTRAGFAINPTKTRMQYRTSRQDVTGLVVNSKANIPADYRRRVRAMAHRLFMTGRFELVQTIPDPNNNGVLVPTKKNGSLDQLHGMLGHIDAVDRHNALLAANGRDIDEVGVVLGINSKENLYRRFLMFKCFYAAPTPVIVCEGKTDNVYIKHAIRGLATAFPNLATSTAGKPTTLLVRILKYPETSTGRILGLNGGIGDFIKFIPKYVKEINRFKALGMQNPVILLVDNDDAGRKVRNVARQNSHTKPTATDPFLFIAGNLYLVMTPLKAGQTDSVIEDAFGDLIKNLKLNGKSFHPDGLKTFDKTIHYGKYYFSQYVENNSHKIDFRGFTEILSAFDAVIRAHRAINTQPAAQATT